MSVAVTRPRPVELKENSIPEQPETRMYAIAFDMDVMTLSGTYSSDSWRNAHTDVKNVLARHGFTGRQGSVYFGSKDVNAVTCVLAAMDLSSSLPWFAASVREIRMLRIEELNDLAPAVAQASSNRP